MSESRQPTSAVLRDLLRDAPGDSVTLAWLVDRLGERSFGIILLLLGLVASLPGASVIVGVLIAVPASQMLRGRHGPAFPRILAARRFRTRRLASVFRRAVPPLRYLERFIRPRWQVPFDAAKRLVGGAILLDGALLFAPVPLSNAPPALAIVLLAFAYLEEDGMLLCIALLIMVGLLLLAAGLVWQAMSAAGWVAGLF